ncbi:MAG: tannase/feruloyl esterase family alpha/beta hydrolase [Bryobacteraceae bacterium]
MKLVWAAVCAGLWVPAAAGQDACGKLMELKLSHTTIASAAVVEGTVPAGQGAPAMTVPPRCVVKAVARPTSDSEIKFELWMPVHGWNGKYEQVGNGGWAGAIPVQSIAYGVQRGYAAAGTDDGHAGGAGAAWAIGHPEKLIDFGYRALHQTNVQSKAIIAAYYSKEAARSYFFGCSDGGREALAEAQRYPEDFDGIVAGAPANDWSHLFAGFLWNELALLTEPGSAIPAAKLPLIEKASLTACDTLDGVKDGLIEDPRTCHFDPSVLTCKDAEGPDCLTAQQVASLKKIYAGPKNPRTGEQIFPGYAPGTEAAPGSWPGWIVAAEPDKAIQFMFGNTFYGQAVLEDPKWNFRTFDMERDAALGHEKGGAVINSINPDLRSFRAHGGKLIQYHGWGDAAIAPLSSINYYEKVRTFLAKYPDGRTDASRPIQDFYRLFMVPGMGHCGGGYGPNNFGNIGAPPQSDAEHDVLTALDQWVEKGVAPERLIGTGKSSVEPSKKLTRPLCPYPQVSRYDGKGDANEASSFACATP